MGLSLHWDQKIHKKKKYMFISCSWKIHKKLHVTLEIESEVDAY